MASVGQSVRRVEGDSTSLLVPDDARETCPHCRLVDAAAQLAHRATLPVLAGVRVGVELPAVEADLRARLLEHVAAGDDVVLDFSFWSRRMRDDFVLPEDLVAEHFDHFEPPTPDEGPLEVVRQE